MSWEDIYKSRLVDAEEAVSKIKSNSRVVFSHAVGEPSELIDALVKNKENYENLEIVHMVAMGKGEYAKPGMEKYFRHNSLFVGASTRDAVSSGRGDYTPCFFYEVPRLFKKGYLPVDVALIQVSEPDEHGYCSFGVSNDYTKPAAESAKLVIAEVNKNMPRTLGDSFIHVSNIDYMVEVSHPLIELKPAKLGEVEKSIGRYCASLIEDGSTLQLGIGAIPDAVLMFLKDKKDLGIHSEMISDGVVELVEAGVINNSRKTLHPGKIIVTFLMGTRKLYDFVDNNPMVETYPVDYVNNPLVIMKNSKMVSINSCVQVDLMGQVCSESIGLKQISGVGGQVDFVRGTDMAEDGKSIIAIPSTASHGKVSRIVPLLDTGAAVTTSRNEVDYIITEYGIAHLRGKTLKDRARALINIAYPDFRESLEEEFEKRFNCKI
ncbi:MAG: 4-hydroxybutyrate CoA-transferase [Clostridium sp.]|jgi:4-hydroxybutyrate CoA-transferase|uniref:acetyl-CoA hydrolase/transferase family protein n=1 Tax=Clostridium sp. TaxID=1506 RepID=UPI0025C5932F|nr:acetyl-CoA hydrolase/transferase C-terminal domain-containing protein [Clostridium sp.]MCH3964796.1 4-hydroxybutyrate CoA-transferase [Clostridium sp.]MCI1715267.1 4-hydroxybutyrate CoA-transferase [Clostridium sp.]MCI1799529.1 4-hydroxybutyrate CoA-transferase [Clostridium sp.]MCI1813450.1 4-hydroxybutyrate CoA-transferase [Clostridium sp.]MCI1870341.1 4-hydroxybutyrate CoA-transferase [Clostridium sp.]